MHQTEKSKIMLILLCFNSRAQSSRSNHIIDLQDLDQHFQHIIFLIIRDCMIEYGVFLNGDTIKNIFEIVNEIFQFLEHGTQKL